MGDSPYRSDLEAEVASQLSGLGVEFEYERNRIPYMSLPRKKRYTPDFWLANGIILEVKGHFKTSNRRKLKAVRKRYPDLDIRLVFSRASNTLGSRSSTTYGQWCDRHGFPWSDDGFIPHDWIQEPAEADRIRTLREVSWRWENREYDPDAELPDRLRKEE